MAFRASSNASNGGSTAITGVSPTGIAAGDRLYAAIYCDSEIVSITPPPFGEWRRIAYFSVPNTGARNGQKAELWEVKNANTFESYAFTASVAVSWMIQCACFSGRSNTDAVALFYDTTTSAASSPVTITSSGVTATSGADLALFAVLDQTVSGDTWGFAPSGSWVERQDNVGGGFVSATIDTIDNTTAGATGSVTNTATIITGTGQANYTVCI